MPLVVTWPVPQHHGHAIAGFASEQCPEGFVAVAKSTLRILTLERLGETFNQQSCPLRYTPRKFIIHPEHKVTSHPRMLLQLLCQISAQINELLSDRPNESESETSQHSVCMCVYRCHEQADSLALSMACISFGALLSQN